MNFLFSLSSHKIYYQGELWKSHNMQYYANVLVTKSKVEMLSNIIPSIGFIYRFQESGVNRKKQTKKTKSNQFGMTTLCLSDSTVPKTHALTHSFAKYLAGCLKDIGELARFLLRMQVVSLHVIPDRPKTPCLPPKKILYCLFSTTAESDAGPVLPLTF